MLGLADPVVTTVDSLLVNASVSYRDAKEVLQIETGKWQGLIRDAVDQHGLTIARVAQLVGVAPSRVHAIIANVYSRESS